MGDAPIIRNNANGTPAIRGTRLSVYAIMDHYFDGEAAESIADFYRITVEEVDAAVDYINAHIAELMPRYQTMLDRERRGNSPEVEALFAKAHDKLMGLKARRDEQRNAGSENVPIAR